MTDAEKGAWLTDVRRQAEYENGRFPGDDWPPIVLALLAILDERTNVAKPKRERPEFDEARSQATLDRITASAEFRDPAHEKRAIFPASGDAR